jgi:hypothetical protein
MNFDNKLKINISFFIVTSFLLLFSCASNKPDLSENHPEIEKLWVNYFENLSSGNYEEAVSYLHTDVLFSFNGKGIEIDGTENLKNQLIKWKENLDSKKIYLKLHSIKSERIFKKMTMIDVVQGEYSIGSDELQRETRRYYHFYNRDDTGWKLYMIAGANVED